MQSGPSWPSGAIDPHQKLALDALNCLSSSNALKDNDLTDGGRPTRQSPTTTPNKPSWKKFCMFQ